MGSELDLNDLAHGNRLALEELAQLRRAERERDELLAAIERYMPFLPVSTAKNGGAARFSENVLAADNLRDAIAKVKS